jgi:integrase
MRGYIQPRGKNTYRLRFPVGKVNGNLKYYSETFHGLKREADERMTYLLAAHGRGEVVWQSKITLQAYLSLWMNEMLCGSVSKRTFSDYGELIERYITPEIGYINLAKLSPMEVQGFYNGMRERGLSPRTVRYTHNVLSKALKQAKILGYVGRNVASLAQLPIQETREMKAMTPDQVKKFLEAAKSDRHYALWHLVVATGLRPEEYLALRWDDLRDGVLMVQRAVCYNRKGGGYYYKDPKTKKSNRAIPLTVSTLHHLENHQAQQAIERAEAGYRWQDEDLIFPSSVGKPFLLSNLHRRHFKPVLEAAELSSAFRVYDLRHTHASILLNQGSPLKDVSERLGHSSTKITSDTYWHTAPEAQMRASQVFEDEIFAAQNLQPVKNIVESDSPETEKTAAA